ncbi:phage terminase small subunit P27 family [Demequina lutea]|uniref:P27 family predicted phage terminase small subunit n=1 Tax=Demequina lutea TaxID=431489 RepID=A0A7Y9ZDR8_9MICO|nr:phage terminase small subunit P27 family [Demequina lutea]NYI41501.1 P27 family predicted phage terminase small subunit [Demequina lutea]
MPNRRAVPVGGQEKVFRFATDARVGGSGLDFEVVPAMLDDAGRAEFVRLGEVFADQPTRFREGDRAILTAYCLTWSLYVMTAAELASTGILVQGRSESDRSRSVKNPALVALTQTSSQLRYLARELGLTPDARGRMGLKDEPSDDDSEAWS